MTISESKFRWTNILGAILLIAMVVDLYLIFMFAPEEGSMGQVQRIFYFHVPSAWVSFLAFFVVFCGSVAYLWKKERKYDSWANSSAEIGVIFATLVLITGPIWARPVWNTWWEWSPRLTLFLVLWFIYVAYLMLRNFVEDKEKSARFAAVFGIVGFIDVPIVYMSIRLWRDIHPSPVIAGGDDSGLHPDMKIAFFFSLFTFTLLFFYLLIQRNQLQKSQETIAELKRKLAY
ncbi:cytochrome C assembly protein [candidate division KSB1 bacterium]|nr:cytochrome C assembly protein [candidate division KSB1 bacterium]NIR73328.1 cytochrome C assembly protein [candidate division KSB1 bacterium]NIS27034.1 cytochrome C assembly protein [candidate division KSB1 bacterium]NIT73874.1 cytochrome C assembly protein [candidate division KSB1 bacterium]NIU27779.1 cytochrome C assembly protein [candidate division KSB1 bacterium]